MTYADSVRAHVEFASNAEDIGGAALTMPGQYLPVCRVPAKADGRPHSEHGMFAEFSVE